MTAAAEGPPPATTAGGAAAPARPPRSFAEAVRAARRAAGSGRARPASGADAGAAPLARASPRRAPRIAREGPRLAHATAGDARAVALRDAASVEPPPPIASAAAVARVALAAQGLGPVASLELRFPGELAIALTQTAHGVAVVVDPGAISRVRALAELPHLVRALRDRGVPVASARVAGLPRRVDARGGLR